MPSTQELPVGGAGAGVDPVAGGRVSVGGGEVAPGAGGQSEATAVLRAESEFPKRSPPTAAVSAARQIGGGGGDEQ